MASDTTIYTVGYSTHEWADFLSLLKNAKITAVADVRSHPTARLEQYRRENLSPALRREGIEYVFLGDELGARREEEESYVDGRVDYELVARLPAFKKGIDRLKEGVKQYRIAMLCAEKEPLVCHRSLLIARHLKQLGWQVIHLHADGTEETHQDAEQRMISMVGIDPLFDGELSHEEKLDRAYREQAIS